MKRIEKLEKGLVELKLKADLSSKEEKKQLMEKIKNLEESVKTMKIAMKSMKKYNSSFETGVSSEQ